MSALPPAPIAAVKAVIFDYGGVISNPPNRSGWGDLAAAARLPVERLIDAYLRSREPYDLGLVRGDGYWQMFGDACGERYTAAERQRLIELDMRMWETIDQAIVAMARQLQRAGFVTGILSNMHADLLDRIRQNPPWLSAFDVSVFSCDLGLVKPDARIYRSLLDRLQLAPADVLFIDDAPGNIEAARAAGLHGIMFTSSDQLRADLAAEPFGISIANDSA
jgi:putative hydrolase of the HAD superfamily